MLSVTLCIVVSIVSMLFLLRAFSTYALHLRILIALRIKWWLVHGIF